jgi:hypothetical protein
LDELARVGDDYIRRRVEPAAGATDRGKFVAVSVDDDDFEIAADEHAALKALRTRHPHAELWLGRLGEAAAYRMRSWK